MTDLVEGKVLLTLIHSPNLDIEGGSGYWEPPVDPERVDLCEDSLEDAVREAMAWRDRNHLGGGNWGRVEATDGMMILHIACNGRVWPSQRHHVYEVVTLDCGDTVMIETRRSIDGGLEPAERKGVVLNLPQFGSKEDRDD